MSQSVPLFSQGYRLWMMTLLVGVYASSSLDRLILATLAQAMKRDLLITDFQFGLLNGVAFAVLYTLAAIPIGHLADRKSRVPILAIAIGVWSAMTALSALAASYLQLMLMRIGVSVGEAACSPVSYSLLSDQYPARNRAGAVAILGLGVPLGAMIGAVLGGWASETVGWRYAFVIAGVPGLALALLVFVSLREPPRGSFDPPAVRDAVAPPFSAVLRRIASKPAYLHLMAVAALCIFCNNALNLFIPSFFVRVHGLGQFEAGKYFGGMIGIGAAVGTTGLGLLIARIARRDPRWYGWAPGIVMICGVPLYLVAFTTDDFALCYTLLFIATCIGFAFLAPVVGATQNMMEPRMRASAAAVLLLAMHLVGGGLGPTFMGWASDLLAARAFGADYLLACPAGLPPVGAAQSVADACKLASGTGLRQALMVSALFFLWGALHCFLATRSLRQDLIADAPAPADPSIIADPA